MTFDFMAVRPECAVRVSMSVTYSTMLVTPYLLIAVVGLLGLVETRKVPLPTLRHYFLFICRLGLCVRFHANSSIRSHFVPAFDPFLPVSDDFETIF